MPLSLAQCCVEFNDAHPKWATEPAISSDQLATLHPLLHVDHTRTNAPDFGERCMPLDPNRWAVGRATKSGVQWRIVPRHALCLLHHPAWLWTCDAWFESTQRNTGPAPTFLSLKHQLRLARALGSEGDRVNRLIAASVAHLRQGKTPIALVVPAASNSSMAIAYRWLTLSILSCLPPTIRTQLKVSTFEDGQSAIAWDFALCNVPMQGYTNLSFDSPPDFDDDLVASALYKALSDGRVERVEAMAYLRDGSGKDAWMRGVKRLLDHPDTNTREISPEMVRTEPHKVLELLLRLQANSKPIDVEYARRLAAYTIRTGDPIPWHPLASRTADERTLAVHIFLKHSNKTIPTVPLLHALSQARPKGTLVGPWSSKLLAWSTNRPLAKTAQELLHDMLTRDPMPQEPCARAAIWTVTLQWLLSQCRFDTAVRLFSLPAARRLIQEDIARVVALAWLAVPTAHRTETAFKLLLDDLLPARDADQAMLLLHRGLISQGLSNRAEEAVRHWARQQATGHRLRKDLFLEHIRSTEYRHHWVSAVTQFAPDNTLHSHLAPLVEGQDDPLWVYAEASRAARLQLSSRQRLLDLNLFLPAGGRALEGAMRQVVADLANISTPDAQLAEAAKALSTIPGASSIWSWLDLHAAPKGSYSPNHLMAALKRLNKRPLRSNNERQAACTIVQALGKSADWSTEEHADWLAPLIHSMSSDPNAFNNKLATAMVIGLSHRDGLFHHLGQVTNHFIANAIHHDVFTQFVQLVLPTVWPSGAPSSYIAVVDQQKMLTPMLTAWQAAVYSTSRPPPRR